MRARLGKVLRHGRWFVAAARTLSHRTDIKRWTKNATETPPWDERNIQIAELIPDHSSVLDLGAGAQTLRKYLRPNCRYQPCDLVESSPDILRCDFNRGIYPDIDPFFYDYVICSGLIEYLWQPEAFLKRISQFGSHFVLSYCARRDDDSFTGRLATGWVNHMSFEQMSTLIANSGIAVSRVATRGASEFIFVGERQQR